MQQQGLEKTHGTRHSDKTYVFARHHTFCRVDKGLTLGKKLPYIIEDGSSMYYAQIFARSRTVAGFESCLNERQKRVKGWQFVYSSSQSLIGTWKGFEGQQGKKRYWTTL